MLSFFLILLCLFFRAIPHPPNFAPVGGAAILAGRTLPLPWAVGVILTTMVASDWILSQIHGYPLFSSVTWFVYGAFCAQAFLGRLLRKPLGGSFFAATSGALLFFLVTNFGVWLEGLMYPKSWEGLLACYIAALPFFKNTLLGNIFWTLILCSGYKFIVKGFRLQAKWIVPVPIQKLRAI